MLIIGRCKLLLLLYYLFNSSGKMGPPPIEEPEYIRSCKNAKFKKILKLLHYIDKNVNVAERFRDLNVLEIRILSVDTNWRGKGIGKALIEKSM